MIEENNVGMIVPDRTPNILTLVPWDDPILTTKTTFFNFADPPMDPEQLAVDLIATMRANRGIGLAANQVGIPYRVFAMDAHPAVVCFNPVVTSVSDEMTTMDEGCLSFPGLVYKVARPNVIRTRFAIPTGQTATMKYNGMTARQFLHEMEHLEGHYPFEGISRLRLQRAIKNAEKNGVSSYTGKGLMRYAS